MAKVKTAYRWNANFWYFKTIEVKEDPDFANEYNLPSRSTWEKPPADNETQWAKRDIQNNCWTLEKLSMSERLKEGLITQAEYEEWYSRRDAEFISVLKQRAMGDVDKIALKEDIDVETTARENADTEIMNKVKTVSKSLQETVTTITTLQENLVANGIADEETKSKIAEVVKSVQANSEIIEALKTALDSNSASDEETKSKITDIVAAIQTNTESLVALRQALTSNETSDAETKSAVDALASLVSTKAESNHTHKYAGSSSVGGAATSANKLATARKIGNASFNGSADISLAQMGVTAAITAALQNAGSGITVTRKNNDCVIRDTKNKFAVKISTYKSNSANTTVFTVNAENDFNSIIGCIGSCESSSARYIFDEDLNEFYVQANDFFKYATLVMFATLK